MLASSLHWPQMGRRDRERYVLSSGVLIEIFSQLLLFIDLWRLRGNSCLHFQYCNHCKTFLNFTFNTFSVIRFARAISQHGVTHHHGAIALVCPGSLFGVPLWNKEDRVKLNVPLLCFPEYAQVLKMLGNGRLEAMCFDGTKRLCHIRGKLRKKVGASWPSHLWLCHQHIWKAVRCAEWAFPRWWAPPMGSEWSAPTDLCPICLPCRCGLTSQTSSWLDSEITRSVARSCTYVEKPNSVCWCVNEGNFCFCRTPKPTSSWSTTQTRRAAWKPTASCRTTVRPHAFI